MSASDPWGRDHWMNRAPAMLRDLEGPDGEPLATHFDRRWLWRLEKFLAVCGTNASHRQMRADLHQYLHETCEHVWTDLGDYIPVPSVQCLWCNEIRRAEEVQR